MMEATASSGGEYASEIAGTLRFEEEIQSLINNNVSPPSGGDSVAGGGNGGGSTASFTALLGLPPTQAVELLHGSNAAPASATGNSWRFGLPLGCSPTFPSNAALVERAARFSVFASAPTAEDSPQSSSAPTPPSQPAPAPTKMEPEDPESPQIGLVSQRSGKRKEHERNEKSKGKGTAKKSRSGDIGGSKTGEESNGGEKLPYVHVRARRGQATDSHSLAERARREKINARMKLLQELVPGCNKISGTAMVLDEIINHVQLLQRQVEFLSMRLAAVNPRIDYAGLDAFFSASAEFGRSTVCNDMRAGVEVGQEQQQGWPEASRRQLHPIWHADLVRPPQQQHQSPPWERDHASHPHNQQPVFINPGTSFFPYDSPNSASLQTNQLKTEL